MAAYLQAIHNEATLRGYLFDATRIGRQPRIVESIKVTRGQLQYEWQHLRGKLLERDPKSLKNLGDRRCIVPHPAFVVVRGKVESWEKTG